MRLYTEEQVREAIKLCTISVCGSFPILSEDDILEELTPIELPSETICVNCDEPKSIHNICMDCIIKVGKQNIQLPSDEQIWDEGDKEDNNGKHYAFTRGAKWMRNKIQGGNNEQ